MSHTTIIIIIIINNSVIINITLLLDLYDAFGELFIEATTNGCGS
jgi:hypothetical protein